jgi:uncharacterized YigZ family protein
LNSFKTIATAGEGQFKEKGSKFLAFAYPVESEADVKGRLEHLKKKYFDARHHCYAFMLGPEKKIFRAADDGEPGHSAGDPILGQIRSRNLTNVLVVVVRYFGGVKLGVGGLITAYRTAAALALDNAVIIEKPVTLEFRFNYEYHDTPVVMKLVRDFSLRIIDEQFETSCQMVVECEKKHEQELTEKLQLLNATGVGVKWTQ